MDAQRLFEAGLQSPVLVVLITSAVGLFVGRQIIDAKNEQIKTKDEQIKTLKDTHAAEVKVKDEQIAALERWVPANIVEQLEATKRLYQLRLDDANAAIELMSNQTLSEQQKHESLLEVVKAYVELVDRLNEQLEMARQIQSNTSVGAYTHRVWTYPVNLSPFVLPAASGMPTVSDAMRAILESGAAERAPGSAKDDEDSGGSPD
jgi:hypothetical protein